MTIDQPVYTVAGAPMYVAIQEGFFKAHGINVQFSTLSTAAEVEQALESGSINFATGGSFSIVEADEAGAGYEVIENFGAPTLQLCVTKSFAATAGITPSTPLKQMLTALKGARFGVNGFGSPVIIPLYYLIEQQLGQNPASWVTVTNLGSVSAAQTAFEQGQIDVLVNSPPVCQQTNNGEVLLTTGFLSQFSGIPYQAFYGVQSWLATHTAQAKGVAQAMAEGNAFVLSHPATAAAVLQKDYFPTVPTATILSELTQYYSKTIPADGRATQLGWEENNSIMLASGVVTSVPSPAEGVMWTNEYLS